MSEDIVRTRVVTNGDKLVAVLNLGTKTLLTCDFFKGTVLPKSLMKEGSLFEWFETSTSAHSVYYRFCRASMVYILCSADGLFYLYKKIGDTLKKKYEILKTAVLIPSCQKSLRRATCAPGEFNGKKWKLSTVLPEAIIASLKDGDLLARTSDGVYHLYE